MYFSKFTGFTQLVFTASLVFVLLGFASDASSPAATEIVSLDGPSWTIAEDPQNIGKKRQWCEAPMTDAKPALLSPAGSLRL